MHVVLYVNHGRRHHTVTGAEIYFLPTMAVGNRDVQFDFFTRKCYILMHFHTLLNKTFNK